MSRITPNHSWNLEQISTLGLAIVVYVFTDINAKRHPDDRFEIIEVKVEDAETSLMTESDNVLAIMGKDAKSLVQHYGDPDWIVIMRKDPRVQEAIRELHDFGVEFVTHYIQAAPDERGNVIKMYQLRFGRGIH